MAILSGGAVPDELDFSIYGGSQLGWFMPSVFTGENQNVLQIPGFSDVPLVVNVVSSAPDPMQLPLGDFETAAGAKINEVLGGSIVNGFTSIPSGGIDFPSARPTDPLGSLISGGFGLAQSLIQAEQTPNVG